MNKFVLFVATAIFSSCAFASSFAVQFDSVNKNWPSQVNSIPGIDVLNKITTMGGTSIALGKPNLISINNGKGWSEPLAIHDFPQNPGTIEIIPRDEDHFVGAWIINVSVQGNNNAIAYFDGQSVTPAGSFPCPIDIQKSSIIKSGHLLWAFDYNSNNVFSTASTDWKKEASLPDGKLITVTTDSDTDDIYALELDTSTNKYFITHFITTDGRWSPPDYINYNDTQNAPLTDLMVMDGGKTLSFMKFNSSGINILVSKDGGNNLKDTEKVPSISGMRPYFYYLYNGNKAHILWSVYSSQSAPRVRDTVAYFNPGAKNPAWISAKMPEPLSPYSPFPFWITTGEDGTQLWINGGTADKNSRIYYYDIKSTPKFVDTHFIDKDIILYLVASNQSNAYGFGLDKATNSPAGFYYDGNAWKITDWPNFNSNNFGHISTRYRNDWRFDLYNPIIIYKLIVDDISNNFWIYSINNSKI